MTAVVTLKGLELKDTLLIPDTAVVDRNRKRVVYLAKQDHAEEVTPVLAATTSDLLPVIHGLSAGDRLIVEGLKNVVDGTTIEVAGEVTPAKPVTDGGVSKNAAEAAATAPDTDATGDD
jgi:hypothetical protein